MSAAELRKAAETLRERAEKATAGPWVARLGGEHAWVALYDDEDKIPEGESLPSFEQGGSATSHDAAYIATMHPGVGLALADWLDTAGTDLWAYGPLCECGSGCHDCDDSLWEPHVRRALAVARLINGGAA